MQQKNIALSIVLTIVTCGIYGLYWFVTLTDDVNTVSGQKGDTSGGVCLLLTIVTCGIYGIYWAYKIGEKLNTAKMMRQIPADSSLSVIYLVLSIFGLQIITYALAQNELNKMLPPANNANPM